MSVETQKASVFTRDALEEHPDMLSEENHEVTPPTVLTSRDSFSLKNFPATLYGRIVLIARSFVTCEEETNRSKKKHPRMPKLLIPPSNPWSVRRRQFRWPPVNQQQVQRAYLIDISKVLFKNYSRAKLSTLY